MPSSRNRKHDFLTNSVLFLLMAWGKFTKGYFAAHLKNTFVGPVKFLKAHSGFREVLVELGSISFLVSSSFQVIFLWLVV